MIVVGVLATIGATVMSGGFRTYFLGREIAQDDAQGRLALERMSRELRAVRSTADLDISVQNQVSFTDLSGTAIGYRLNAASQIERSQSGVAGTYQPLADNVSALTITYLHNDGESGAGLLHHGGAHGEDLEREPHLPHHRQAGGLLMRSALRQRGQLLVAGVVLIVVVALMVVALGFLYVSSERSGTLHSQSGTAYAAAYSGIEAAKYQFSTGTACGSLTNNQPVGSAQFSTLAGTLYPTAFAATLASNIPAGSVSSVPLTFTSGSLTNLAPHGEITIGTESIDYGGTSATGSACSPAPCLGGIVRGANGTTAAAHSAGAAITQASQCLITSTGTAGSVTRKLESTAGPTRGRQLRFCGRHFQQYARTHNNPRGQSATRRDVSRRHASVKRVPDRRGRGRDRRCE